MVMSGVSPVSKRIFQRRIPAGVVKQRLMTNPAYSHLYNKDLLVKAILGHKIDLVIDTPTQGRDKTRDGFLIRHTAIETGIYCITAMDTANALVTSMEHMNDCKELTLVDIAQL